jgi:nucleoside-diphosphate-sugar epimerase
VRVLFVGGTGNISLESTRLLAERGVDLTLLNRGVSPPPVPQGVRVIHADVYDRAAYAEAVRGEEFDVVANWIAYTPEHVAADLELFGGHIDQYVFISTATVYRKPSPCFPLVEDAPLGNPTWKYADDKIRCEELLRSSGLPTTIVRPSYTYGRDRIPTALEGVDWTIVDRLRRGKPAVVPGDGESLWTMTHSRDFARAFCGLLGNAAAVGESFHLTSDEVLTWNQIVETIARAAGLEPNVVGIPSRFIASFDAGLGTELLCDKAFSLVFDNSKIKRVVPGFEAQISFADGVAESIEWLERHPEHRHVDAARDALLDRIVAAFPS